jgi:phenylpropionate dioxygenase-like ring-hydroxylating dioxygenase large terminal subunit
MFRNRTIAYSRRERAGLERDRRSAPADLHGPQLAPGQSGDYVTDVAGMPVLMTRGADGGVRAFANLPPSRRRWRRAAAGARLPLSPGPTIGRRRWARPTRQASPASIASLGLVRPSVEPTACFVRPKPARPEESVEIISTRASRPTSPRWTSTLRAHSADRIAPRNWKFAIDTFLEGYHIPHLHRKTIAPYFIGNCGTFDPAGLHGRMCVARTSIDAIRPMPEPQRNYQPHVIAVYQLFPNTIVIWQVDHIEVWRAFPGRDDPSHCDVEMTIYKPKETEKPDSHWEKNRDIAIRTVMEEDFPLGERMQMGFESGAAEEVIYGRNEPSLVHFHTSIRNALGVAA